MVTYRPDKIREARLALGMTQRQFALRLGVTEHTVANWESGRTSRIRFANLLLVARLTSRPMVWFSGEDA